MSDNGKVVGVGVLMAVGGFCLGAQLGLAVTQVTHQEMSHYGNLTRTTNKIVDSP